MTISTTTNRVSFAGNGSTTAFATGFKFFADSDLTVVLITDSTAAESTKTLTTDYTVSGAGVATGGTVTMVVAPAVGETLVIVREQPYTQGLDLVENDPFPSQSVEDQLDKLTILTQQNEDSASRALKVSTAEGSIANLPNAVDRASKVLAFDSNGAPTVTTASAASAAAAAASAAEAKAVGTTASQIFTAGTDFTAGSSTSLTFSSGNLVTDSREVFTVFYDGVAQHNEPSSVTGNTVDTTLTLTAAIPTGVTEVFAVANLRSVSIATASDSTFSIQDDVDSTKIGAFQISGVATGTTRTLTWPDANGTISLVAGTETLTNKTIAFGSNTISGTLAQFNTAVTDATLVSTAGSETLTNKTLTSPTVNTAAAGGTWTAASTWTLPAFTLGGTVTSNGQSFSGTIADLGTVTTADIDGGTIDGTTIVVDDDEFTVQDNADSTKKLAFQLSGITTGNTRTLTAPDESGTLPVIEYGTWTPVLEGQTTAGTQTYSSNLGWYVRIGDFVVASFEFTMSAKDGATSGNIRVAGLPFTSQTSPLMSTAAIIGTVQNIDLNTGGGYSQFGLFNQPGASHIRVQELGDNVAAANITDVDISATSGIRGTIQYVRA